MSFPQGIAFRATSGYVTDGANDFAQAVQANNYPTTSTQGNTVGYEVNGDIAGIRDRNAGNDVRIAGCNFSAFLTTFRIDLPATGSYKVRIAMGDAASYGQAAKCEIFDGTSSLGVLSSTNTTGSQRFRDATDTEYTNVTWPGSNTLTASLTFASTICRFKFGDGSNTTAWAYVYIEAAGGGASTFGPIVKGGTLTRGLVRGGRLVA